MNAIDLTHALRRAAQRVPGPAAERSLAQAAPFRLVAGYHDLPLPEPELAPGPLRLGPEERWCLHCGETMNNEYCHRCGSQRCRPAAEILRTDEYYIAT